MVFNPARPVQVRELLYTPARNRSWSDTFLDGVEGIHGPIAKKIDTTSAKIVSNHKNKYSKYEQKATSDNIMNIKEIYEKLIENGFYDNISIKIRDESKEDDSIIIPTICKNRLSEIKKINQVFGYDIYISPCRIGRNSKYCSQKIDGYSIKVLESTPQCPICYSGKIAKNFPTTRQESIVNNEIISPCFQLNKIIKVKLKENFLLIPNAYPYLECQFLITTSMHRKQMEIFDDKILIDELFKIFLEILLTDDDVIFFNGICGNSLEHFHCQYTTSIFPFLTILDNQFTGVYDTTPFRAYVLVTNSFNDILELTTTIKILNLTFNFITRKSVNQTFLQFIFFIRDCKSEELIPNLNFGATELSGIIVGNNENDIEIFTEENINNYINLTNNISNYEKLPRPKTITKSVG
jgi:hypothetical protein